MKIVKVRYTNWQGINDELEPQRLNLLTGPNGSGKTARMRGIQFAITGATDLGDVPNSSKLISGKAGGVTVYLDNGFSFERTIKKLATSVKQEIKVCGASVGAREGDERIKSQCGSFAPMFNLSAFLGLSAEKQRNIVIDLCSQSGDKDIAAEALYRTFIDYLGMDYVQCDFVTESLRLQSHLPADFVKFAKELCSDAGKMEIVDAIKFAKDELNRLRSEEKTKRSAVETLFTQKSNMVVPSMSIEELKEELKSVQRQISEVNTSIGKMQGAKASLEQYQRQIDSLKQKKVGDPIVVIDDSEATKQVEELSKQIIPVDMARANLSFATAKDQLKVASEQLEQAEKNLDSVQALYKSNATVTASNIITDVVAELDSIEGIKCLKHVSSRLSEAARHLQASVEQARERLSDATKYRISCIDKKGVALRACDIAEFDLDAAKDQEKENAELQAKIDEYQAVIDIATNARKHNAELKQHADAINSAQSSYDKLKSEVGQFNEEELNTSLSALNSRSEEIQEQIRIKQQLAAISHQIAKLCEEADEANRSQEAAQHVHKALQDIRDGAMGNVIQPLLDRLVAPYGNVSCALSNSKGKASFSLGVNNGIRDIEMDALSGGEGAIFAAGLAYALVSLSESPLKCLFIEAAEVGEERIQSLLDFLSGTDGVDHVFVATHLEASHPEFNNVDLALTVGV